jgi:broad specificity phosphatase PhoE
MSARVLLVVHGPTQATREAAFAVAEEPLSPGGTAEAASVRPLLPRGRRWRAVCGPERRCRESAEALGLAAETEPALADWAAGAWVGRRLDEVAAQSPEEVRRWTGDPAWRGHGGESLLDLGARVGRWLDAVPAASERTVAVAPPAVVRAAVVHALGAAPATFWRIDVAPLTRVALRHSHGRWSLVLGAPRSDPA